MEIAFIWVALAILVAVLASKRNRSAFVWLLLAVVLSPLLAGLILLIVGDAGDGIDRTPCPFCKEPVIAGASKCKHCGSDLTRPPQPESTGASSQDAVHRPPSKAAHSLGRSLGQMARRIVGK